MKNETTRSTCEACGCDHYGIQYRIASVDTADVEQINETLAVLHQLAKYTEQRLHAVQARISGRINEAQELERSMERTFNRLPEWATW